MYQADEKWLNVLEILKTQISKPSFETWLKKTTAKINDNTWIIIAENEFARDWLEQRYLSDIKNAIFHLIKESPEVMIIGNEENYIDKSASDLKIVSIVKQIESLSDSEREKLFSIVSIPAIHDNPNRKVFGNPNDHFKVIEGGRLSHIQNDLREIKGDFKKIQEQFNAIVTNNVRKP